MELPGIGDITTGLMNAIVPGSGTVVSQVGQIVGGTLGSDPDVKDPDAQQKFNDERAGLYAERDGANYDGKYDPKVVHSDDPFDAMSHDDILTAIEKMGPVKIKDSAAGWRRIGELMSESNRDFDSQIQRAIAEKWEGAAAQSASTGVGEYTKQAENFVTAANLVGNKLDEAYTGYQQTVDTIPSKPGTSTFEHWVSKVPIEGLWKREQHESDEAREQAVQIMKTVYMPVVHQADDQVPVLPAAVDPTNPQVIPKTVDGRIPDGVTGVDDKFKPPPGSVDPSVPGDDGTGGLPTDDGSSTANGTNPATDESNGATTPQSADANSGATTPAAAASLPGGAGSYGGSGAGSGSGGGGAGSGAGSHGAGSGSLASGSIMQSALGSPSTGGGSGSGSGSGSPGRAGAAGAGGMAPGGKGKGDDDKEHKTPSYLVNVDNGNELIGTMPKVAPPVIGG